MFDSTPHGRILEGEHLARTGQEVKQKEGEPWHQRDDRVKAAADWKTQNA